LFTACLSHHIAALTDLGTLLGSLESIRAKWYNFGLQLRVDIGILDDIAVQYSDPLDCLRETLKHWLKTFPNCTWKCIVNALGSPIVGANVLALELERKHCPQLEAHAPQAQSRTPGAFSSFRPWATSEFSEGPSQPKRVHLDTGCEVFNGASVQVSTSPAVDMYAEYLKGYYESCGVATEDTKWPPTPTVCYINLAYISKSKITRH